MERLQELVDGPINQTGVTATSTLNLHEPDCVKEVTSDAHVTGHRQRKLGVSLFNKLSDTSPHRLQLFWKW